MLIDCFEDEYYKLQYLNKNAIYCLETALYLHDLSDRVPTCFDMIVCSNYSGGLIKNNQVRLTYVKKEILNLGVIHIISPFGFRIKVYDIDKTICDVIKNKRKIEPEIFSNSLKKYVFSENKNITKLIFYSKK